MLDQRTQNWIDGLADPQRERALRVIAMPPEMAVAYAAVEAMNTRAEVKSMTDQMPLIVGEAVRKAVPKPVRGDLITLGLSAFFTVLVSAFGGRQ